MSVYQLKFRKKAEKDLEKLPKHIIKRIDKAILALSNNPRPSGCRKLEGRQDEWRIRVGDYRIVYSIQDDILIIEVIRIAHRQGAYKH